jgi:hypothetical protein
MPWTYEENPDRKHKRRWENPEPGFVEEAGEIVGKCPTTIGVEVAEELLNAGIEYSPARWPHSYPQRIYNIHESRLYRATPTVPGRSYHGFPEHPKRANGLPRELKARILELAREKHCEPEVSRCLSGK